MSARSGDESCEVDEQGYWLAFKGRRGFFPLECSDEVNKVRELPFGWGSGYARAWFVDKLTMSDD
jgi:hypothetical protein